MVNLKNIEYDLKRFRRVADAVKEIDYTALSDEELKSRSSGIEGAGKSGGDRRRRLLTEAFALVYRGRSHRALGLTPHDNQLMARRGHGGRLRHRTGYRRGENARRRLHGISEGAFGKGVHVLTFNDYLARRDAVWMGPVYERLGITVGHVDETSDKTERRAAYLADVTYVTAREAGFDYLRGFLGFAPDDLVHRPFYYALVDEADSILIDEARIPLVIAGDEPARAEIDRKLYRLAAEMEPGVHFDTDENGSCRLS